MNFLWGAATSAYQVEGANDNCDWYDWERTPGSGAVEPAGSACEHVLRYREDIAMLAALGLNCYRFSVEWSRVEPQDGRFDERWLRHYRDMAVCCREHGLLPVVTLHHFTNPRWLAAQGGWEQPVTARRFARFTRATVEALGDQAGALITVNEPNIPALLGYEDGVFPPWPSRPPGSHPRQRDVHRRPPPGGGRHPRAASGCSDRHGPGHGRLADVARR